MAPFAGAWSPVLISRFSEGRSFREKVQKRVNSKFCESHLHGCAAVFFDFYAVLFIRAILVGEMKTICEIRKQYRASISSTTVGIAGPITHWLITIS